MFILTAYFLALGCFDPISFGFEDSLDQAHHPAIVATGDGEGHISPCQSCPAHLGFGGLARRASLIAQLRRESPLLLLDAGNALFGAESAASRGQIIADAMTRLEYDVINISYRDFRYGKLHTAQVIRQSGLHAIGANILDAASGEPIFPPSPSSRAEKERSPSSA
jgi:2',3'-cyclic-nucleotide 2'-phosphodiesterase (5'-nucleotidase family)